MKVQKILDKTILFLLQALVFTVPLYFAFLYKDYSVFTIDKTAVFQILVEVLLFLTILRIIIVISNLPKQSHISNTVVEFFKTLGKGKILKSLVLFFIIFSLSVIFSSDFHQSFWGSYWRKQGLVIYWHYFLFVFIIIYNFLPLKFCHIEVAGSECAEVSSGVLTARASVFNKIQKIISAILFSSFFVSILGILQWLGYDPLPWQERIPVFGRITSTMGQPIFLANYLLFVIPLTVYRLLGYKISDLRFKGLARKTVATVGVGSVTTKQKIKNKTKLISFTLYLILLILQLVTLFFTSTRGAIIGFFAGVIFFIFVYTLIIKKNKKLFLKLILGLLLVLSLMISLVVFTKDKSIFFSQVYWRIKNITNIEQGSTALRVKYWSAGVKASFDKPILGYGPETQQSVYVGYYDNTWIPYEKIGLIPDRAHNEYLDIALSGGVLLLLSYLIMLFYFFYVGIKYIYRSKDSKWRLLLIFILSALFAYLVSIFFAFSVVETNVFFFLFIALIVVICNSMSVRLGREQNEELYQFSEMLENKTSLQLLQKHSVVYLVILIFSILVFLVVQNVNLVRADYHFREARSAFVDQKYIKMYEQYSLAIELNHQENYYKQMFVDDAMRSMFRVDSVEYRQLVSAYVQGFLGDFASNSFYDVQARANIYALLGRFSDKKYLDLAEVEFENLITLSPYLSQEHIGLAQVYIDKEEYAKAIDVFKDVLAFLPKLDSKYLNKEHRKDVEKLIIKVNSGIDYCNNQLQKSES